MKFRGKVCGKGFSAAKMYKKSTLGGKLKAAFRNTIFFPF
jgi:hypothetical protein